MIRQKAPNDKTGDDAMVLTMIDWRDCAVIEYVPERVLGSPVVPWLSSSGGCVGWLAERGKQC